MEYDKYGIAYECRYDKTKNLRHGNIYDFNPFCVLFAWHSKQVDNFPYYGKESSLRGIVYVTSIVTSAGRALWPHRCDFLCQKIDNQVKIKKTRQKVLTIAYRYIWW